MALDLEEQDQLDALKAWWKVHGRKVIAAATALVLAVAGVQAWQAYQRKQTREAAALFNVLRQQLASHDLKQVREVGGQIMERYPRTAYAADAAMVVAQINFDSGDRASAKAQYAWLIEHARERQTRDLARLRLAVVLVDEKDYAGALKQLEEKHDAAFSGLYSDLKGDVFALQGKTAEAARAYRAALEQLPAEGSVRAHVQIKLDALREHN